MAHPAGSCTVLSLVALAGRDVFGAVAVRWPRAVQWRARKNGAHPLYQSSSHDYGTKPLGDESRLRPPDHPKGGSFTATFKGGGAPASGGLRTGLSKHRYLKEMDGMV